jgi:hypothetical protein
LYEKEISAAVLAFREKIEVLVHSSKQNFSVQNFLSLLLYFSRAEPRKYVNPIDKYQQEEVR